MANTSKATKEAVRAEVVNILSRATTPHCADKMRQKLLASKGWHLFSGEVYRHMRELADAGQIDFVGYKWEGAEGTPMFKATDNGNTGSDE